MEAQIDYYSRPQPKAGSRQGPSKELQQWGVILRRLSIPYFIVLNILFVSTVVLWTTSLHIPPGQLSNCFVCGRQYIATDHGSLIFCSAESEEYLQPQKYGSMVWHSVGPIEISATWYFTAIRIRCWEAITMLMALQTIWVILRKSRSKAVKIKSPESATPIF